MYVCIILTTRIKDIMSYHIINIYRAIMHRMYFKIVALLGL